MNNLGGFSSLRQKIFNLIVRIENGEWKVEND
jgi:hypothetical protein